MTCAQDVPRRWGSLGKLNINLLAHAARKVVECAADLLHWRPDRVCQEARAPLLIGPSVKALKAALDRHWSDPRQKASAVKSLVIDQENLKDRLAANLAQESKKPPLSDDMARPQQLMDQDLEPDPSGGGKKIRIRSTDRVQTSARRRCCFDGQCSSISPSGRSRQPRVSSNGYLPEFVGRQSSSEPQRSKLRLPKHKGSWLGYGGSVASLAGSASRITV